jgi:hypothetical protein
MARVVPSPWRREKDPPSLHALGGTLALPGGSQTRLTAAPLLLEVATACATIGALNGFP